MKLIIAGGRDIEVGKQRLKRFLLGAFMNEFYECEGLPEIVTGGCPTGIDRCAASFANEWATCDYIFTEFPADWDKHGKAAGPIRNAEMAKYADSLLLIWDGKSRGSASMLKCAKKEGLKIVQVIL